MIYELKQQDYEKVRPLYQNMDYHLTIRAVIEGTSPGRIFVDNVREPKTAFICSVEGYFLTGNSENADFNRALGELIRNISETGDTVREGENAINLDVYPQTWETKLSLLFTGRTPLIEQRRKYQSTQLRVNWKKQIPDGYSIHRLDRQLLERLAGNVPEHLFGWMKANWGGRENFLGRGFGYCLLHGERMVSWCIADCVSGDQCEVGIRTIPDYRRRGLARLTVAAAIDYCLSYKFKSVGWHCNEDNIGSWKTAEKVGFTKARDYVFHVYLLDEATHLAETGWQCVKAKRYQEAMDSFEQVFALKDDAPHYWYHSAAMAASGIGDHQSSFKYLQTAIDRGWYDLNFTKSREEFNSLHGTREWEAIITRLRRKLDEKES
jgi:RimJ/RimL family protein N-acetyltransferase